MDPLLPVFSFIVTMFIFFVIYANKEYHTTKNNESQKTEEEKDDEWLDNQW